MISRSGKGSLPSVNHTTESKRERRETSPFKYYVLLAVVSVLFVINFVTREKCDVLIPERSLFNQQVVTIESPSKSAQQSNLINPETMTGKDLFALLQRVVDGEIIKDRVNLKPRDPFNPLRLIVDNFLRESKDKYIRGKCLEFDEDKYLREFGDVGCSEFHTLFYRGRLEEKSFDPKNKVSEGTTIHYGDLSKDDSFDDEELFDTIFFTVSRPQALFYPFSAPQPSHFTLLIPFSLSLATLRYVHLKRRCWSTF
jgi:hypothetical protein